MRDLTNPRLMYAKAVGFVIAGMLAAIVLLLESPTWRTAGLVAVVAWSAARAYYFAFYVIERYIEPGYRFSGLGSVALYILRRRWTSRATGARRSR